MKVLHLNNSDINGGAARAAYRLHQGLQSIGVTSQMLVQQKSSKDKTVVAPKSRLSQGIAGMRVAVDSLPNKLYPQRQSGGFSSQWLPDTVIPKVEQLNPDIINLHWINQAFVQIETIGKFKHPIVWTLHDMWAFTGGCHYSPNCDRYKTSCGTCPQLGSKHDWDLSRWVWQRKAKAWKDLNLTIVTPSTWLAKCARSSSLFKDLRIEVIPHGLNLEIYKPINRKVVREILNLPSDKQLVLFGSINASTDRRKGFHLLLPALQELCKSEWQDKIELVVFGSSKSENSVDLALKAHYLGRFNDDITLALIYSAADVMIVPSTQEAFGQTAFESLACGTPVVAFNATGLKDIVDHQQNGYLAQPFDINDLARGIIWVLENKQRYEKLCYQAREKTEKEFSWEMQAHRYLSVFQDILSPEYQFNSPKTKM